MEIERIVAVDFETTGFNSGKRAVEVAWFELNESFEIIDEKSSLINPMIPIPWYASKIHGITNEISEKDGVAFIDFANYFSNSLDFVDTIIAHNINFDFNVLCAEFYRYGLLDIITKLESKTQICTMKKYK